jgi:hypothetical protein
VAVGGLGIGIVAALCLTMAVLARGPVSDARAHQGLPPIFPEGAYPSTLGERFVNLPPEHTAPLYQSPVDGPLVSEWPGGTSVEVLGWRFFDGYTDWEQVRDPSGNEVWIIALFLDERYTAADPPAYDEEYLGPVRWEGEIAFCANPAGGPPGLDGEAFVALVERAAARWQEVAGRRPGVADGTLPLVSRGRCESSPDTRDDGISTVGWADDLGLAIAGMTWPDVAQGVAREMDVRISRGFVQRLLARYPSSRTLQGCVFSTVVHEMGHVLGLDHPRSRSLPSTMQGFGASRCDKGQPTEFDRANLLRRYGPAGTIAP